ncbi:BAG domain [Phytophthora cactorum]|nr:BAG domain [Phytophthora cactorum]
MEAQKTQEKNRLQTIEQKVKDVERQLSTRLPAQYRHVAAMVCGAKWRLQTFKPQDAAAVVKKMRLELGAFDYRVKEQAELLTRYLIELDGVLSYGDADIKSARKALVVSIQQLLSQADAFKERSAKLKQFGERALSGLAGLTPARSTPVDSGTESEDMHVKALFEESEEEEDSESETEEEQEDADEDQAMEQPVDVKEDEPMEPEVEADDEAEDDEEAAPPKKSHASSQLRAHEPGHRRQLAACWRPYYQLQRRQDGIYLMARLNNIDRATPLLRITGFRLPTQKDIVMSRLSGAPTFGRFEIAEQFPRNMLNMEEATQQIFENGTLQIRMPYYVMRHPLRYRPASLFQPQDCFVW